MDYKLVKKIFLDCFRLHTPRYAQSKVLTVAHDNDRSLLSHGKYYSPLIDTIEDDLRPKGVECQSIARIISTVKGDAAYGNVVSPEGSFARAMVTKRIKALFSKGEYPFSEMEENIWADILNQTGVQKVLAIQPSRELCMACHKRGIWVADVQHGVISDSHPWYGEQFRAQDPVEYLPHAFLCWDYGSQEVIKKWSNAKGIHTPVTGNRWVARFLKRSVDDKMVNTLFDEYLAEAGPKGDKPTILISLSWGDRNIPNGFMIDSVRDVIRKTSDKYRWLVRLHPNQIKGFATEEGARFFAYYDQNLAGHAEWKVTTRSALPLILTYTDLHLTWNSSVCIEAAQMGIRSALLDPRLRASDVRGDYYGYYKNAGMVELVDPAEDSLEQWIGQNIGSKSMPERFEDYDREYRNLLTFLAE